MTPPTIDTDQRYTFVLEVVGRTLGNFASVQGLEATVQVFEYREGGNNDLVHRLPGAVSYPNLVLSGGMMTPALSSWFRETRLGATRQEVTLTLSADGQVVRRWSFADAFPVRWVGPTFDAGSGRVGAEVVEIAHGGLTELPT
ncbi:phage tail protein [Paraconexibacter algicola]|uniref:Phage tail protein n=1 Tax=Paraconexibacter algicola TaxID=2133960 RepID=A0A2T4UGC0_9ACTN|nr:phage tail protein [Paraconexibacter algicola]PTL58291.1 phage tail protein [Paraconexibacter algicola]